jgi:hypothetical protein
MVSSIGSNVMRPLKIFSLALRDTASVEVSDHELHESLAVFSCTHYTNRRDEGEAVTSELVGRGFLLRRGA